MSLIYETTFLGRLLVHGLLLVVAAGVYVAWPRVPRKVRWPLLAFLAVGVRILVWPVEPSDDVNRYVWEGKLVLAGENPYMHTADDPEWEGFRDSFWEGMNHKDYTTIYPPLMELVFAGTVAVSPTANAFKGLAGLFDLACLPLIWMLCGAGERGQRRLALFAVFPVSVISFAGEGHFDSLMIFAWLAALLCLKRRKFGWGWFLLGIAVQIKLVAVVLAPLFLRNGGWRKLWALFPSLVVPCLFFWEGMVPMFHGILAFGGDSSGNGLVHLVFEHLLGEKRWAGLVSALLLSGMVCYAFFRIQDETRASLAIIGTLVIVSPTVTYWYLSWILPFVVTIGISGVGWWVLGGTGVLYYAAWWNRDTHGTWWHPYPAQMGQWIPPLLVALWGRIWGRKCAQNSEEMRQ